MISRFYYTGRERPLRDVPFGIRLALVLILAVQLVWHALMPAPTAFVGDLPPAPDVAALRLVALGDPPALARGLGLWVQMFDNPPGVNVPFRDLDYVRLEGWLDLLLDLDGQASAPLLAAGRVYTMVPDVARQRRMLEFVYRRFLEAPNRRWRWLADAALLAKHRLGDLDLARRYAAALSAHATGPSVPFWARDLYVLVLQDRCELEAAEILIGGLIASGSISDAHELGFLEGKLAELKAGEGCTGAGRRPAAGAAGGR